MVIALTFSSTQNLYHGFIPLYNAPLGICALNERGINISKDLVTPMTIPYIVSTLCLFHARKSTRFGVISASFDLLVPSDKHPSPHAMIMRWTS